MKINLLSPAIAAWICLSPILASAQDLDALSRSPVWQVRYGVCTEFKSPTPAARAVLERLALDTHDRVATQAFAIYSGMFVDLDPDVVRKALDRGELFIVGMNVADTKIFNSAKFWLESLPTAREDSLKGRVVRALGLIGDRASLSDLPDPAGSSENPYLLLELAMACRRLGNDEKYLAALERLINLTVTNNVYYQTKAIDCLIQTHPDRAKPAWEQVDKQLSQHPDIQPNWVFAHVLQKDRLP